MHTTGKTTTNHITPCLCFEKLSNRWISRMCFVSSPNQRWIILFLLNIHVIFIFLTSFCKTPLWKCLLYFLGDKNCGVRRSKMTITRVVLSSALMGTNSVVVPATQLLFQNVMHEYKCLYQSEFLVISMVISEFFNMHPSHFLRK